MPKVDPRVSIITRREGRKSFFETYTRSETETSLRNPSSVNRKIHSRGARDRTREQGSTGVRPVVARREAVSPRNSFRLNLCIAARVRPTLILEVPFVQLLMRSGHFIFTLCAPLRPKRRDCITSVRSTCRAFFRGPVVYPYPGRFVPAYANLVASMCERGRKREREKERDRGRKRRDLSLGIHLPVRTIVRKIITVFTAERIHHRALESALLGSDAPVSSQGRLASFRVPWANTLERSQRFVNLLGSFTLR